MEKRYNKELQERTRAYVEAGTSQAELSRRLGMNNSSSLSRWLNSSYNGDVEKIEKALEEYFRARRRRPRRSPKRQRRTARPWTMCPPASARTYFRASGTASCTAV